MKDENSALRLSPSSLMSVSIWNAACGADLAITPRCVEHNTRAATGAVQASRLAMRDERPVGFVLASALPNDPLTSPPQVGWIDAIAVLPNVQRQGIGSALLTWAEEWLRAQGCTRVRLGGGLRPFAPGLPTELGAENFFRACGYISRTESDVVWDVAQDLGDYRGATHPSTALRSAQDAAAHIRPAQPADKDAILEFLWREFPNRWRFEFQEFLRQSGRISDYMLLWTERGVDGFCHLTFEDSLCPLERFYPYRLSRAWGQLGPIGVSADRRGRGYGAALLDASLCRLRDRGVRGCVIDWTSLPEFYGKFGFKPYREYKMLLK